VELLVLPNATAAQVGAAVEAVAAAARGRGLRLATVSEMDPPDVTAPAAGSDAPGEAA
jgi:hypothetical protein